MEDRSVEDRSVPLVLSPQITWLSQTVPPPALSPQMTWLALRTLSPQITCVPQVPPASSGVSPTVMVPAASHETDGLRAGIAATYGQVRAAGMFR